MDKETNKVTLFVILVLILVIVILSFGCYRQYVIINKHNNEPIDTSYNKVVLDSIEYNIIKKDCLLIVYKTQFEYEIKKIADDTDSVAVKRFYDLVSR